MMELWNELRKIPNLKIFLPYLALFSHIKSMNSSIQSIFHCAVQLLFRRSGGCRSEQIADLLSSQEFTACGTKRTADTSPIFGPRMDYQHRMDSQYLEYSINHIYIYIYTHTSPIFGHMIPQSDPCGA